MGIPSYYRHLLTRHANLVKRAHPGAIDWLWMDFNCLIYHCLRRPDLRPYDGTAEWEAEFIQAIITYTKKVARIVQPSKGVYIAIDGVVPMAKMKQQRLRRFKSVWLAEHGLAEGHEEGRERWDTNAITPGTLFMGRLRRALEAAAKKQTGWVVSSSDEPGEGEHKIMDQLRALKGGAGGRHAVYGLDADLVILSLLTQNTIGAGHSLWLFREEMSEGSMRRDATGEEIFEWCSIDVLRDILSARVNLRDYCFAMSFLGNDFLPSSLGLKMRENGHDVLMGLLEDMKQRGMGLLDERDGIRIEGLRTLFGKLAATEEARTQAFIDKKVRQGTEHVGLAIGDPNWALSEKVESSLMERGRLVPGWKARYRDQYLGSASVRDTCDAYLRGLQWIWAYYRGRVDEVCFNWYYPWNVPPLWSELSEACRRSLVAPAPVLVRKEDIATTEQLCLVLPPASWDLIPDTRTRRLLDRAPWLFPKEFGFDSVGKRWFWECEADIPIPSILEVKNILGK